MSLTAKNFYSIMENCAKIYIFAGERSKLLQSRNGFALTRKPEQMCWLYTMIDTHPFIGITVDVQLALCSMTTIL